MLPLKTIALAKRFYASIFLATVLLVGFSTAANAQTPGQVRWGEDGLQYTWDGSTWNLASKNVSRLFPNPNDAGVYDEYRDGNLYQRFDFSYQAGYVGVYNYATGTWAQYPVDTTYDPYEVYVVGLNNQLITVSSLTIELERLLQELRILLEQQATTVESQSSCVETETTLCLGGGYTPSPLLDAAENPSMSEADRNTLINLQNRIYESNRRLVDIWTTPACNPHYNRCY